VSAADTWAGRLRALYRGNNFLSPSKYDELADHIDALTADATRAWTVPKVPHDEDTPVTPNIIGGWIYRSAGQSDSEHTRQYAAQLLAAADELDRQNTETETTR
jgi:hypothetical protein